MSDDATPPTADGDGTGKLGRRLRTIVARVLTALAAVLVFTILVAPTEVAQSGLVGLARVPVEGLIGLAVLLMLPARSQRVAAVLGGVTLGVLAIVKTADVGFMAVLSRPFDPVSDWSFVTAGVVFLAESDGRAVAWGAALGAVALAAVVLALAVGSVLRLTRAAARRRDPVLRGLAVLGAGWVVMAILGTQVVPHVPVAAHSYLDRIVWAGATIQDRDIFTAELALDPFWDTPSSELLTALRGKDVVLAFVESYGRVAIEDPVVATQLDAALLDGEGRDGDGRLRASGFAARSAYLTSSTVGGGSWLAQATTLSGTWVNTQQRYDILVASERMTLSGAFRRAGWRTVGIMPGVTQDWPQGAYFGFDRIAPAKDLGYLGPRYSFATMPDQYVLSVFQSTERETPGHPPVMAVIPLISSHAPWSPIPRLVSWDVVGDGSTFETEPGSNDPADIVWQRDTAEVRTDYGRAVGYSLDTIVSYVETYGDDDLVVVFLGDHQPAPVVTGPGASRDAPITIVAKDPAVLAAVSGWGWNSGLQPSPDAPVWRMDTFRDRFLTAFA